jgi:hypothetical protein
LPHKTPLLALNGHADGAAQCLFSGWGIREPQVTVSETCFRAPEICCRSDTVQQKSLSVFEPSPQSHATA